MVRGCGFSSSRSLGFSHSTGCFPDLGKDRRRIGCECPRQAARRDGACSPGPPAAPGLAWCRSHEASRASWRWPSDPVATEENQRCYIHIRRRASACKGDNFGLRRCLPYRSPIASARSSPSLLRDSHRRGPAHGSAGFIDKSIAQQGGKEAPHA
eukprot:scaffold109_cov252-Pinguiococcus_pyrenoidosus.AAC.73